MFFPILIGTIISIIIFFIGMVMMTHSITSVSNQKLQKWIALFTKTPLTGIIVGIIVTSLIQSSSATTILVVSLVNSKNMNLYQAASVIMGSNIGTTMTGQLITFDFFSAIPYILMFGVILFFLNFHVWIRAIGKFFIGFSLLFLGLQLTVYFLNPLTDIIAFDELIHSIENQNFKAIMIGTLTTAIIQSSSTGLVILQSLAFNKAITIYQAAPIILGQNIGTCVTTLFSSIATDINGKRAAFIHIIFNIIGVLLFYPFLTPFAHFIYQLTPSNAIKQIANFHTLFNILSVMLLFPFINGIVFLSKKIIK